MDTKEGFVLEVIHSERKIPSDVSYQHALFTLSARSCGLYFRAFSDSSFWRESMVGCPCLALPTKDINVLGFLQLCWPFADMRCQKKKRKKQVSKNKNKDPSPFLFSPTKSLLLSEWLWGNICLGGRGVAYCIVLSQQHLLSLHFCVHWKWGISREGKEESGQHRTGASVILCWLMEKSNIAMVSKAALTWLLQLPLNGQILCAFSVMPWWLTLIFALFPKYVLHNE